MVWVVIAFYFNEIQRCVKNLTNLPRTSSNSNFQTKELKIVPFRNGFSSDNEILRGNMDTD